MSSLASIMRRLRVDVSAFQSIDVSDTLTSVRSNIRHTPNRRLPVGPDLLARLVSAMGADQEAPTVICAVLIMYFTFIRQSNIGPRNKKQFDSQRHLLRTDVVETHDAIILAIKWSKSTQGSTATSVAAPRLPGSPLCPLRAFSNMICHSPTIIRGQPLFSFRDATPLPTSYIQRAWKRALAEIGIPSRAYTLHSLRRGGATEAFTEGNASIENIMAHGMWTSGAVNCYLPNDPRSNQVFEYFKDSYSS